MIAFAATVVMCCARWPKSTTRSGCKENDQLLPVCPLSLDIVAYSRWIAFAISENVIAPADPPEPSPRKIPFQVPAGGIHTSKLMSDWLVGVAIAATRQKVGGRGKGWPV